MSKKTIFILVICIIVALYATVHMKKDKPKHDSTITVGLTPSKQEYFSKELSNSFKDVRLLEKGDAMIKAGEVEEAIVFFENLIYGNNNFEMKGLAKWHLVDAYEKKRDYTVAYKLLYEDTETYKVPVTHEVRVPIEERLKYLKYASEGEYVVAVEHAILALEAASKVQTGNKELYQQRLNDLKAAKSYIESLKK